jgi:catechol 2,3-dioxygenase-like lactoylglutathione lyase family enzyme
VGVKLDHLTILVSDWAAYERHYGTLLPLAGFFRVDDKIWTDGDGFFLQFGTAREGTSAYERYGAGLNHWGIAMPSPESVEELRERLIAGGIDAQPVQNLGGAQALFIPDPDGLRAEFTYTPPGRNPVG